MSTLLTAGHKQAYAVSYATLTKYGNQCLVSAKCYLERNLGCSSQLR